VVIWAEGELHVLRVGAPDTENEAFYRTFAEGIAPETIVILLEGPAASSPPHPTGAPADEPVPVPIDEMRRPLSGPPFTAYGTGMSPGDVVEGTVDSTSVGFVEANERGEWIMTIEASSFYRGATVLFLVNGVSTGIGQQLSIGGGPDNVAEGIDLSEFRGA
jgi:hypothetical protein